MTEQPLTVSETMLGYEVFRPLWALLEVGAAADAKALGDFSLTEYVTRNRQELDQLLDIVRTIGAFSPTTLQIFEEQGGWGDGTQMTTDDLAMHLVMSSGYLEDYPPDVENALVVRRMLDAATELQLAELVNSLVGTAIHRHPGPDSAAPRIAEAVRIAGRLAGTGRDGVLRETVRLWRAASLPAVLRPDSPTPREIRAALRTYARALEGMTG